MGSYEEEKVDKRGRSLACLIIRNHKDTRDTKLHKALSETWDLRASVVERVQFRVAVQVCDATADAMKNKSCLPKKSKMKIDAHQHFWKFDPVRDSWINDEMSVIQKDFLPHDLYSILIENDIEGCVTVQSDQSEEENVFQLANAEKFDFIKGVVGWVDFEAKNIEDRLIYYGAYKKMKGFRHVLQAEPQRDFMLRPAFMHGISLLQKSNFTYDILIFPDQLKYVHRFVTAFPEQLFVIDHIAKPYIKDKKMDEWKKDIFAIGKCKNVYCKISGVVTEADWKTWKKENFAPYLDAVVDAFGIDRIMFGSDWPVCLVAASYAEMIGIVYDYFSPFSENEKEMIFGKNAINFYKLEN